jgi:hypothetical protein
LASFPAGDVPYGTLTLLLPATLTAGTYELRLMGKNPDFPSLLAVIARSEPLVVALGNLANARLVPILGPGNAIRLSIDGPARDGYRIEATGTLAPPNWQVIAILNLESGDAPDFIDKIDPTNPARYYRLLRP